MTDERKALFWLSASGLAAAKQNKLLEIFGSASEVRASLASAKLREFVGDKCYARLCAGKDEATVDDALHAIAAKGIRLLLRGFDGYPAALDVREAEPPPVLYSQGNADLLRRPAVCIVGTRRCTDYGRRVANEWAAALAAKFVIVSGYATGVDTYAVKSCLAGGGSAIIVLACALDKYDMPDFMRKCPRERLLLLSEYPLGTRTAKFSYHERNRLLSGLSRGVIVVEAPEKSGALITADCAAAQNRPVFAVPGDVFSERSRGVNLLLRHGAIAATSPADVCEDLGTGYDAPQTADLPAMTDEQRAVYDFLSEGKRHFDDIAAMLGIPAHETSALLSMMELEGIVERRMQNFYALLN